MPLIEWDAAFNVDNAELDEQHRQLVAIINDLHAGLEGGGSAGLAVTALAAMMTYIRKHFLAEECYMREIGFPDTIAHIKIHNECYALIESHCAAAVIGGPLPAAELLRILRSWLEEHLLNEDKKYYIYAAENRPG